MIGVERILDDTPLFKLTVGEFKNLFESLVPKPQIVEEEEYVYGYKGLASLLNCSICAAKNLKLSGKIDKAIIQEGRKIMIHKKKSSRNFKELQITIHLLINPMPDLKESVECKPLYFILNVLYYPGVCWFGI